MNEPTKRKDESSHKLDREEYTPIQGKGHRTSWRREQVRSKSKNHMELNCEMSVKAVCVCLASEYGIVQG